jgi:hypothetical protein
MDSDRSRDLAAFANAAGQSNQPIPGGHALVRPTTGLAERIIGAQHLSVHRDEAKVLQKLASIAAAAGNDWLYRFPVRKRDGGQDWIEGPSIKLANDVARIFGNNINEIREIDVGDAWVFYARFTDLETGFSMERAYRQRKSQGSMKTKDADRQLDIAYSIGQSKAIRNCICNALQIYADYAFEHARNSLVEKIGKDLDSWRARTLEGLGKIPVDVARAERVIGRAARDWLAPHVAQIIAMMKSVADGMATADDVFPPLEAVADAAGGAEHAPAPTQQPLGDGGAQSAGKLSTEGTSGADADESRPGVSAATSTDTLAAAYKRGQEAKATAGHPRKVPVSLRDSSRVKEAEAWLAGYDGKSAPDKEML